MSFYQNKKVLVTGGTGFIGSHLVEALKTVGAKVTAPSKKTLDLKQANKVNKLAKGHDYIFHLAANVGGIYYNTHFPASLLRDNILMTVNIIEAARLAKVKRFSMVSSACVYPRFCTIPTPETEGFKDEPEPTNYGYGWSKRFAEILAKTYTQEFKMKISIVRPYNAYGPRDNFDPKNSHVIPALIKRICDGKNPVKVWGDGSPTRSFIYVTDVVQGMMLALQKYPQPDPINLGTKEEISIKDLVKLIIKLSNNKTKIKFDTKKPNGQPRRNCDTKKAKKILNFKAKTTLEKGLPKVIKYYRTHVQKTS